MGIYTAGRFAPLLNTALVFRAVRVDPYSGVIIAAYSAGTLLVSGDVQHVLDVALPFSLQYAQYMNDTWHVVTDT